MSSGRAGDAVVSGYALASATTCTQDAPCMPAGPNRRGEAVPLRAGPVAGQLRQRTWPGRLAWPRQYPQQDRQSPTGHLLRFALVGFVAVLTMSKQPLSGLLVLAISESSVGAVVRAVYTLPSTRAQQRSRRSVPLSIEQYRLRSTYRII